MRKENDGENDWREPDESISSDDCDAYTNAELEAIVDGRSTEAEAAEFSDHLANCGNCRARIDALLKRLNEMNPNPGHRNERADSTEDSAVISSHFQPVYPRFRELVAGEFIGRFEISKVQGKGGTSIVYECMDRSLRRRVAVKVLNRNAFDDTNLARLEREAQSLARLDHPGIVRAYEIHPLHDPPFIVLEMVGGGTAHDLLKNGPLPHRDAARLIADVAEALHHAHEQGILHRDIKPSNLLIDESLRIDSEADSSLPRLKISDFGLARPIKERSELTTTGAIVGTPAYMSPEQTLGQEAAIGAASDIYSLGVVLYEFLIGHPPLMAESAMRTLQRIQEEEPLPPRSILWSIPVDLETICLKCLRKKPEDRYRSALDLADDLRRHLDGLPIVARPVGHLEKAGRWIKRHRSLSAALAASTILAIALMAVTIRFAFVQNRLRAESDANATAARINADRFEATAKELLIESDHTRNFIFTGIQNLDEIAKGLAGVRNQDDAMRLSEKARKLNAEAVERYVARSSIDEGNARGEKIDTIFRDGRNLLILGMKEQGARLLERIRIMAFASRPGEPDHLRLLKYGTLTALVMAEEDRAAGRHQEATDALLSAWRKLGFEIESPGVENEHLVIRMLLLNQLIEAAKKDKAAAAKFPPKIGHESKPRPTRFRNR